MSAKLHDRPRRHGGDRRGNNAARRARKLAILARDGDGTSCPCVHCGDALTADTLQQDRVDPAGGYTLTNLQPSCGPCNKRRSNRRDWAGDRAYARAILTPNPIGATA